MQQVIFSTDKEILKKLYDEMNLGDVRGANFVLLQDNEPIGICRFRIDDKVTLEDMKILSDFDNFSNKDFFFKTLLFKLSFNDYLVFIPKVDESLKQFGFAETDGGMEVNSKNIEFPHCCG